MNINYFIANKIKEMSRTLAIMTTTTNAVMTTTTPTDSLNRTFYITGSIASLLSIMCSLVAGAFCLYKYFKVSSMVNVLM